jgi:hypothetical protein
MSLDNMIVIMIISILLNGLEWGQLCIKNNDWCDIELCNLSQVGHMEAMIDRMAIGKSFSCHLLQNVHGFAMKCIHEHSVSPVSAHV